MDLSKHTIVDGKRSPKLTNRTQLVWDVVDTGRLWLMEFEERPKSSTTEWERQLAEALVALGKYDAKLIQHSQEARVASEARADKGGAE